MGEKSAVVHLKTYNSLPLSPVIKVHDFYYNQLNNILLLNFGGSVVQVHIQRILDPVNNFTINVVIAICEMRLRNKKYYSGRLRLCSCNKTL